MPQLGASIDACEEDLNLKILASVSEYGVQTVDIDTASWDDFMEAVKAFVAKREDPGDLPILREYGSRQPRYYEFVTPPYHLLLDRDPASQTVFVVAVYHFKDRARYIKESFATFLDNKV